ncbi:hypothetical protein GIS00_26020 [Nakamurella sp. YIM 132087]|uniref:Uncharacterized protein n=1 Tax=Nakamurella alba TaxID=2665158 RepID=A0A7K1FW02_9ACTN|nr:hypothetical protein [Nakamurella alba]MTD17393.1 hypothetical protein [Nakamurella alba]
MADLVGHGITVPLPSGWEGRIGIRQPVLSGAVTGPALRTLAGAAAGADGADDGSGNRYPVTHLANFALPADRGDFGSGAVDIMGTTDCLVALIEYGPENVDTALFARRPSLPQPGATDFDPNTLQHKIRSQLGYQRFCTVGGRAFCVYVVIGGSRNLVPLAGSARSVLGGIRIGAAR